MRQQVWNNTFQSISNVYWHGFSARITFFAQCDASLWRSCVLSLKHISCRCEPRGLQRIFSEDFTLCSSHCPDRNSKCIYSAHVSRSESCDCNFYILAKFPLVAISIISVPLAVRSVWHSAVTLSVRETFCLRRYRPHIPRTQSCNAYFSFSYHPNSPRVFFFLFFFKRVCDGCLSDAAASFSKCDIYAAAGFYMFYLLLWHLFSIFLKIDLGPDAAGHSAQPQWCEGWGICLWGRAGAGSGVVDDQHRSENFENILLLSSWRTGRQTAATAGGYWFGLQEVLENPGTNAGRTYICFGLFTFEHTSSSSTQPHPWPIREALNKCTQRIVIFGLVYFSKSGRKLVFFKSGYLQLLV